MFVDTTLTCNMTLTASGGTAYLAMPYRGKIRGVRGIVQDAANVNSFNVTLTAPSLNSGTTIGVAAFANAAGVGAKDLATYTPNASTGTIVVPANSILQATVAAKAGLSCAVTLYIDLDPYAAGD